MNAKRVQLARLAERNVQAALRRPPPPGMTTEDYLRGVRHSLRFRRVANGYPRRVADAYDGDIARAARDSDAVVAATVAAWEAARGWEPNDWTAIGRKERGEDVAE